MKVTLDFFIKDRATPGGTKHVIFSIFSMSGPQRSAAISQRIQR
jgi:hypothetical protein